VGLGDEETGAGVRSFMDHRILALALAFAPDGRPLAVGGHEPGILLYDVRDGDGGHPVGMPIACVNHLAFAPDGRLLAASSNLDPEILLWDLAAGRERARLRGHGSPVLRLAFAPDKAESAGEVGAESGSDTMREDGRT
jgi:WD40 repeat protein